MSRAERSRDAFENNDPPSSRSAHETSFEPGHELDSALGVAGMWGVIEGSSSSIALLAALYCSGATGQLAARVAAIAGVGGAAASAARGWARCALEHATYTRERAREEWELKHYEEGERKEVVDLWVSRGVSRVDAEAATAALSGYKEVFVDIMMDQEVQIHAVRSLAYCAHAIDALPHLFPPHPAPCVTSQIASFHPSRGGRNCFFIKFIFIHVTAAAPLGCCWCRETEFCGCVGVRDSLLPTRTNDHDAVRARSSSWRPLFRVALAHTLAC